MTPESGYLKCWFDGPTAVMDAFRTIVESSDRQNQFSCGLSWLDEVDCDAEVESDAVSYDTLSATQEFLATLLKQLPELQFEGRLEHSWPILPCKVTTVEFSSDKGSLRWEESCRELSPDFDIPEDFFGEPDEEEEIVVPLTPYDE